MEAFLNRHTDIAEILVERGAKVDALDQVRSHFEGSPLVLYLSWKSSSNGGIFMSNSSPFSEAVIRYHLFAFLSTKTPHH